MIPIERWANSNPTTRRKKQLTLGCAVGILACGACFGPGYKAPPPPPIAIDLQGVRSIWVVPTSAPDVHFNAAVLAREIRKAINIRIRAAQVRAPIQMDPGRADATLTIAVLSEKFVSSPPAASSGPDPWKLQFKISARLAAKDGRVIWRETNAEYLINLSPTPKTGVSDSANILKSTQNWAAFELATQIVRRMLYGA